MTWMRIVLLAIAAVNALGSLVYISLIGEERKPVTPSDAVWHVVLSAMVIAVLVAVALRI